MSGPAFEALSTKRKRIASELAELESKVRRVARLISFHGRGCPSCTSFYSPAATLQTQIYNLETEYVAQADCTSFGTVLKGFDGFLVGKNAQARNRNRVFKVDDRLFSLSSYTSPAVSIFSRHPSTIIGHCHHRPHLFHYLTTADS